MFPLESCSILVIYVWYKVNYFTKKWRSQLEDCREQEMIQLLNIDWIHTRKEIRHWCFHQLKCVPINSTTLKSLFDTWQRVVLDLWYTCSMIFSCYTYFLTIVLITCKLCLNLEICVYLCTLKCNTITFPKWMHHKHREKTCTK